jgi:hypothetical protein
MDPWVASRHHSKDSYTAWSPDGSRLASASPDNTMRLWEPARKRLLASLAAGDAPLVRTPGGFHALALGSEEPERLRLALRLPESGTEFYLPLTRLLHGILHQPWKVAAALDRGGPTPGRKSKGRSGSRRRRSRFTTSPSFATPAWNWET